MSSTPLETPDTDAPLPEVGPSEPPGGPRNRRRLLVAAVVVPALIAAGFTIARMNSDEPQVTVAGDGLPAELRAGQAYEAEFAITFPADWPDPDETGRSAQIGVLLVSQTEADLCASAGLLPGDLPEVSINCEFTAPSAQQQLVIEVVVQTAEAGWIGNTRYGIVQEFDFEHTLG